MTDRIVIVLLLAFTLPIIGGMAYVNWLDWRRDVREDKEAGR